MSEAVELVSALKNSDFSADDSSSSSSSSSNALIVRAPWYRHPTLVWLLKSSAVNFILPFFNGVMVGFGEILANEVLFRYGWFGFVSRPQLGLYPTSGTSEYQKTIQTGLRREQKQRMNEKETSLVD